MPNMPIAMPSSHETASFRQPHPRRIPVAIAALGYALALAFAAPALSHQVAEDEAQQMRAPHGVHIHTKSTVKLAVEEHRLVIELDSPTMNLFGFEHPPRDEAQSAAVEDARAKLADGANLFRINAEAGCELTSAEVRLTLEEPEHDHHHGPEVEDHDHHSDAHVDYSFTCANPDQLNRVEIGFFEVFPMTERLRVKFGGASDEDPLMLTPDNIGIDL